MGPNWGVLLWDKGGGEGYRGHANKASREISYSVRHVESLPISLQLEFLNCFSN